MDVHEHLCQRRREREAGRREEAVPAGRDEHAQAVEGAGPDHVAVGDHDALQRVRTGPPARRIFADVGEPLGTLLRFGVLGFGAGGWLGMAGLRLSLFVTIWTAAILAFPARRTTKKLRAVGRELDAMLAEGQGGFTDMMRNAMARR